MAVHVFGAPCSFAPIEGPVHKRAMRTEAGFYVGVQGPMCLVLRKSDMKLMSCSKKKIIVYEAAYTAPLAFTAEELNPLIQAGNAENSVKSAEPAPSHILSIKSVSTHTIPTPHTTGRTKFRPPTTLDKSAATQSVNQGEGRVVPEHIEYEDDLQLGLSELRSRISARVADPGIRQKVIQ